MRTQPQDVIAKLEADNSRLAKEAVLLAAMKEGLDEFFEGVIMCFDALCTFGVKQVPEKTDHSGQGLPWPAFKVLAEQLRTRQLTGHAARDAIALAMAVATVDQWNGFYRRILIKDLRCGTSEKTVNKVAKGKSKGTAWDYPKYAVPVFACQLAHDSANHESKLKGKKLIETKLDGVRVETITKLDGTVEMFSRNGKQFFNFSHIEQQIAVVIAKDPPPYDLVLDGEIMSATFQDLMKQVQRKNNADAKDAVLWLFDLCPLDKFKEGMWSFSQKVRSQMIQAWVKKHQADLPNVTFLEYEEVDLDTPAGKQRFQAINRAAIANGYEGIMAKDPDAPYVTERTVSWLKMKPYIEVTLEIVDVEEGTGKNAGRAGALVCVGEEDGKTIRVNVGSGLTDEQRIAIWADWTNIIGRSGLLGQMVEVRADAITQNQDGTYSLRFPRFKTFRGFAKGEKL